MPGRINVPAGHTFSSYIRTLPIEELEQMCQERGISIKPTVHTYQDHLMQYDIDQVTVRYLARMRELESSDASDAAKEAEVQKYQEDLEAQLEFKRQSLARREEALRKAEEDTARSQEIAVAAERIAARNNHVQHRPRFRFWARVLWRFLWTKQDSHLEILDAPDLEQQHSDNITTTVFLVCFICLDTLAQGM